MQTITEKLEQIKGVTEKGVGFWRARALMPLLGYQQWRRFEEVIHKAMEAFDAAGEKSANHFAATGKMVALGSDAMREVSDYYLTRAACYIVAMNCNARKPEVAEAQKYFAIQTRRMEKIERAALDVRRDEFRKRVETHNSSLSSTAQEVGVKRFGLFHGAGINAMYDMPLKDIRVKRGLKDKDNWLDFQGIEELAANDFRITQTEAKIKREGVVGEEAAIRTHSIVGRRVRETIKSLGNTLPENLPVDTPIGEVRKRLKGTKAKPLAKS